MSDNLRKPVMRLGKLRKKAGLTQLQCSQKLNVTENTYANWEKSRTGVELIERVINLCKLFDCNPEDLIEYPLDLE
jgi:transcriptional regulator with XRE-family HTH domain